MLQKSSRGVGGAGRSGHFDVGLLPVLVLCLAGYGVLQLKHLSYPLIWQDEGETVMFAQRILEHGFPKVHDRGNTVYGMGVPARHGVKEESDAYIGSLWGQYYFAALGVWLAEGQGDLYAKTARLRLPFALAGVAGLSLIFMACAPAFADRRRGSVRAAIGFVLMISLSTSLILHLREARYYALVVLLLGCVLLLQFRCGRSRFDRRSAERTAEEPLALTTNGSEWLRGSLQAVCLLALFNVFYPAAVTLAVWLGLEACLDAWRARASGRRPALRAVLPVAMPVACAALLCVPIAVYFEMASLSALYSSRVDFGLGVFVANAALAIHFLARYEFLGVVLLARILLLVSRFASRFASRSARIGSIPAALSSPPMAAERVSAQLGRLCIVWLLVAARNPIFFERYLVALSPLLSLIFLLDCHSLFGTASALAKSASEARLMRMAAMLVVVALLGTLLVKRPEVIGRWVELTHPYRGPLDAVIPRLQAATTDSSRLRIATNYEAEAYMYYLGSHVVGRFHEQTPEAAARDLAVPVDIVIPRKGQPRNLSKIYAYLSQGEFERVPLGVPDLPYNNIPELFRGRVLTTTHFFRSQHLGEGYGDLYIQRRIASGDSG